MTVRAFTFNPFATNLYVCHDGRDAVLVDPASHTSEERNAVLDYLDAHELTVRHLLLTHAHLDHVFDLAFFAERLGLVPRLHPSDAPLLAGAVEQARAFGVAMTPPPPTEPLGDGDVISFGAARWTVRTAPGHSPGSVLFVDEEARFVIGGDVLFAGSIGRTDLWRGSLPELLRSIHDRLLVLDDDVTVYPGHGPATTVGAERASNPFLTDDGFPDL